MNRREDASRKTLRRWKSIKKWLINKEEVEELGMINLAQGMTDSCLLQNPSTDVWAATRNARDFLTCCATVS
jgi:hypothetical protein